MQPELRPGGLLARVLTASVAGLGAIRVRVEADVAAALPGFTLVGLAGASLRESRERIGRAIQNAGFHWPEGRITVSLAPADVRKDGSAMDLAIAVAILLASGQVPRPPAELLRRTLFVGELALDGAVRAGRGVVAMALDARRLGIDRIVLAEGQVVELSAVPEIAAYGLGNLGEAAPLMRRLARGRGRNVHRGSRAPESGGHDPGPGARALGRVRGQDRAVRALLLAAAGGHHILFQGPPGCGKTLLARALGAMLPPLEGEAAREQRRILSCAGLAVPEAGPVAAPLRAPHHSATAPGLVGGGRPIRPGEITLAHRGVLLLDEVNEFSSRALERLREPLTDGVVRIVRGDERAEFPARFQMVATANPCPCGWFGSSLDRCRCPPGAVERYRRRLSGPLRDRIELWVEMDREPADRLFDPAPCRELHDCVARAQAVRSGAATRPAGDEDLAGLTREARAFAAELADGVGASARALTATVRVARTIASLDGCGEVASAAIAEAFTFRPVG